MKLSRGSIWEAMQTDALEFINDNVNGDLSKALNFYEWREKGGYHVTSSDKQNFYVSCASKEYGEMLAKEVTFLMNQALEHRLLLGEALKLGKHPSPSWLLVTTYYWCVFLCLSWLRLIGKVVTYLTGEEITRLNKLNSMKNTKNPGNGTFVIYSEEQIGTRRILKYRRLKANNFHEALWDVFSKEVNDRLKTAKHDAASLETRLFSLLYFKENCSWPSKLRNLVNYRVGFAYDCVNKGDYFDLIKTCTSINSLSIKELVALGETMESSVKTNRVDLHPNHYGQFLLVFGSLLTHILEDLTSEVLECRNIDRSWNTQRNTYLKEFGHDINSLWPFSS